MNMRIDIDHDEAVHARVDAAPFQPATQAPTRRSRIVRVFKGGDIDDIRRLPRYVFILVALLGVLWAPIASYVLFAPKSYTSRFSLILPGSGSNASINLSDIGQASSSANSAYSSSSLSPTVTYKELIGGDRVRAAAAAAEGAAFADAPEPRVKLIDQTGLIGVEVKGSSPEAAKAWAQATLTAFLEQLDALRSDEVAARERTARQAIADYQDSVAETRARITRLKAETGLVSSKQYEGLVAEAASVEARAKDAAAELKEAQAVIDGLRAALDATPEEAAAVMRLQADPEFQMLLGETAERAAELAVARGSFGPKHPTLITARDAYSGARARTRARAEEATGLPAEELDRLAAFSPEGARAELLARLVAASVERDGLEAEHTLLAARAETLRAEMMRLVPAASELEDLNRDYTVAEAVFASAMARSDTTKADVYASYPLVQTLEPPSLPEAPSSPRVKLAIAAGVAATLMLLAALGLAWARRPVIDRLLHRPAAA